MKMNHIIITNLLSLTLLVGCGPKGGAQPEPDHEGHSDHAEEAGGANEAHADKHQEGGEEAEGGHEGHNEETEGGVFVPEKGIAINDETRAAFGLEIGDVTAEPVAATTSLTAQVYRDASEESADTGGERSGRAYATATLDPKLANELTEGEEVAFRTSAAGDSDASVTGKVWKIDDTQVPVTGMAEVLVEIPDADGRFPIGTFLTGEAALQSDGLGAARIPRSAVLDTAAGPFAYVKDGDFLKRTPIKIGASNGEFVEVTEGLYEGDEIAVTAVQALYITELRATKGGGHSH